MQQTMVAFLGTLPGDHGQVTTAFNLAYIVPEIAATSGILGLGRCRVVRELAGVVWDCTRRSESWTRSSAGQVGRRCWQVRVPLIGSMCGSVPHLNTTSGRPHYVQTSKQASRHASRQASACIEMGRVRRQLSKEPYCTTRWQPSAASQACNWCCKHYSTSAGQLQSN